MDQLSSSPSTKAPRTTSFGENYEPTLIDHFGVWLSAKQIRRWVKDFSHKDVADIGCGHHASFARTILPEVQSLSLLDVSLSPFLKNHVKVQAFEGNIEKNLYQLPENSFDVLMCISVLEHLWRPQEVLNHFYKILKQDGLCLLNVPSWRGKKYLEMSAFKFGLSPAYEINDHKAYYDVKDFWPMLVKAGFIPQYIKCFSHKFGLNTFAVCQKK